MQYASETKVSVDKSKAEIERTLVRYGACKFASGWKEESALIAFEMKGKRLRFTLPLPNKEEDRFRFTAHQNYRRNDEQTYHAWEQACRQLWRALALMIKAKLEAVESGITVFEDEFMANIVMPDGKTMSEYGRPFIESAYQKQSMVPLLPGW